MANEKAAAAAPKKKEAVKMTFQEALVAVRKELSEKVTKVKVGKEKKIEREFKGLFNYSDKIEVEFTSDYLSIAKGTKSEQGLITGLAYIKMGVAKKA